MRIIILLMLGVNFLLAAYIHKGDIVHSGKNTLIWQDNPIVETHEMTHTKAKSYCKDLKLSGYVDWRLPTVKELQNIVDFKRYDPSIQRAFYHTGTDNYWSSTIYTDDSSRAWAVNFKSGNTTHNRGSYSYHVRCVRGK